MDTTAAGGHVPALPSTSADLTHLVSQVDVCIRDVQQLLATLDSMPVCYTGDSGDSANHNGNSDEGGGGAAPRATEGDTPVGTASQRLPATLKDVLCGPVLPLDRLTDLILDACPPLRVYASAGDAGASEMVASLVESCRALGVACSQPQQLAMLASGKGSGEAAGWQGVASSVQSSSDADDGVDQPLGAASGGGSHDGRGKQREGRRVVAGRGKGTSVAGVPVVHRGRRAGSTAARSKRPQRGRRSAATDDGNDSDGSGGSDGNEDMSHGGDSSDGEAGAGDSDGGGGDSGADEASAADDDDGDTSGSGDEDGVGGQAGGGGSKRASRTTRRGGRGARSKGRSKGSKADKGSKGGAGGTTRGRVGGNAGGAVGRGASKAATAAKTTRLGARKSPQHQLLQLWKSINGNKYALPFRQPVNRADAPGYDKIIKQPMDLSTIRSRIESGAVTTAAALLDLVLLTCNNAMVFNGKGSDYHDYAQQLMAHAQGRVAAFQQQAQPTRSRR